MLLRGEARDHPDDGVVSLREGNVLVGEIVIGLGESRGDNVSDVASEHDPKEPLSRFVEVAGECQTIAQRGVGGAQGYRMSIHINCGES